MSEPFDPEEFMDLLEERIRAIIEECIEDSLEDCFADMARSVMEEVANDALNELPEIISESRAMNDPGQHRQKLRLVAPDHSRVLLCYGGLRVDGTTLVVQTRVSSWEPIAVYPDRKQATDALMRVHRAISAGAETLQL